MNVQVRDLRGSTAASRVGVVDCDIHPRAAPTRPRAVHRAQVSPTCRSSASAGGWATRTASPIRRASPTPRGATPGRRRAGCPAAACRSCRRSTWTPTASRFGILNPLNSGQGIRNLDLAAAFARAMNDWQVAEWTSKDARLRASVVVSYEDPAAAVAEIERCAGDPNIRPGAAADPHRRAAGAAPILADLRGRGGGRPAGRHPRVRLRRLADDAGRLALLLHRGNGRPRAVGAVATGVTGAGGRVRAHPGAARGADRGRLRLGAVAAVAARQACFQVSRRELPHLKRLPSEYVREKVWWTTQPMEEPERQRHVLDVIGWLGWDRLLFATDYPHWDFDDPAAVLPSGGSEPSAKHAVPRQRGRAVRAD